ncbi:uncharacterized protein EV420DRAFT_1649396 [Desarmillaria tabescens]|uniref:Uncharacterized protein n=1 Tax=Armillaria tabescens TaxID=1929756 RepID=A0AA39JJ41_ARMTA|nr:uncharacterized protein EV420DRAFT_1649396 [Desarmillaria tabescens]KAK0443112.1 hypothetical protein EV420DRAFT_1649396 [Desarmillaria tabescens]
MTAFPPELVELIIYEAWHSEMPSYIRITFMTTCPSINRTWKAVFAPIASQDIYIINPAYIYYLCDVAQHRKSIIYHDLIPRLTRTLTCFIDLDECAMETAVIRVYRYLLFLPNDIGFKTLFPLVTHFSFVLWWTITFAQIPQLYHIPVCVCYHRYLSMEPEYDEYHRGKTRLGSICLFD